MVFDPDVLSYKKLAKLFFEMHDPAQVDRQGPDVGPQYRSAIFYGNDAQKRAAEHLITQLKEEKGVKVATTLHAAKRSGPAQFWSAEAYHQNYYLRTGAEPYCHKWEDKGLRWEESEKSGSSSSASREEL